MYRSNRISDVISRNHKLVPLLAAGVAVAVISAMALVGRPDAVKAAPSSTNADYFLQLEGIEGSSADSRLRGALELTSFAWSKDGPGVVQTAPAGGGGGGAGRADAKTMVFTHVVSKASPQLVEALVEGRHIREATLTVRRSGENQIQPLVIKLKDVVVSSYRLTGEDETLPSDEFAVSFAAIEYTHNTQRADGTPQPQTMSWNFRTNSAE